MKRWRWFLAISLLLLATSISAHDLMVTVQLDRVMIGAEFVPRSAASPASLIVARGQTIELPADSTYDYIEVAGTLKVSRAHDTRLRVVTLIVLPGGTLDVGTQVDAIPCERRVEFIFRNVPIDTTRDPFTWGNGLINFGRQTRVGCVKTSFLEASGSLEAGQKTVTLASAPDGWKAGDELLLPDTDQPIVKGDGIRLTATPSRRETPVFIAAINGNVLNLSKALDFEHHNITDPQGVVVLRPRVANLTRNIVLRSEAVGVGGTHGHTADIGMDATWDVRANEFHDLGRTLNIALDDTTLSPPRLGTNQRGKYADHKHHTESCATCVTEDNVYVGNTQTAKWGLALHGASDTLIKDNIAIDWPGAGFVTEDGNEVRNSFLHNLAAYVVGGPNDCCGFNGQINVFANNPGIDGNGFWWRGVQNTFVANEGWNSFRGASLFNQQKPAAQYPSAPGLSPDTDVDNHSMLPIVFKDNVFAANAIAGYEFWAVLPFINENLIAAYNNGQQVIGVQSDGIGHWMRNPKLICKIGTRSYGVHSSDAYTGSFLIDGDHGQIAGCQVGIAHGGGRTGLNVIGASLQNEVNIDRFPESMLLENVMHLPLEGFPHRFITFVDAPDHGVSIWNGTDPLPKVGISHWVPQRGSRFVVKNWQGTGQDYLLFYPQQLANNPAWYSAAHQHQSNCPERGLTMLGCWEKYGLSMFGDVLKESDVVHLDGLVNGLARNGLGVAFGPPRAIVTWPTMREPAVGPDYQAPSKTGYTYVSAVLTGDPTAASDIMVYSVDGDPPYAWGSKGETSSHSDNRAFNTPHTEPGLHTVKTWRTTKESTFGKYTILPESEYTAQFFVGDAPSPPLPPPPPPPLVGIPKLVLWIHPVCSGAFRSNHDQFAKSGNPNDRGLPGWPRYRCS
jgi:hypothetical protein